ncbi:MAG TPA: hypothetical protein VHN14_13565 [Kofleriaceae bacterium]|nr:hypothetical protein [Kofleriaceae bacterium]
MISIGASDLGGVGCGDPPLCQTEVFVAFEQTMIAADVDAIAPGVQTDVHIRTSLQVGDVVDLEVLDTHGAPVDSVAAAAAADGSVVFTGVSVPAPRVVLRATGRGTCGEGHDEIVVDVLPGAGCTIQLSPEPEINAYYAPRGVLGQGSDPDPASPGYQTTVRVVTRPGWSAEIFETTISEQSLGVVTAGNDGVATLPATVADGQVEFRATCQGAGTQLASRTIALVADTTAPTCDLVAPMPGTTITPALDANHDVTDGLQIAITAHANGTDVAAEPVMLAITNADNGSPSASSQPSDTDAGGLSTASVLLPGTTPARYAFVLTMRDHAGNVCTTTATYAVDYDDRGCAITVTSPTAPVTHDADGDGTNGSQVDITLAVDPACADLPVTSTCGPDSTIGIVGQDGSLTLPTEICTTSPCQTDVSCTFQVTDPIGIVTRAAATLVFDDQPPVTDFVGVAEPGNGILLTWTSPDHGVRTGGPPTAYLLKSSPVPLTDATFDTTGTVEMTDPPGVPGSPESFDISSASAGVAQYFGIATLDDAGHRSAIAVTGPIVPGG